MPAFAFINIAGIDFIKILSAAFWTFQTIRPAYSKQMIAAGIVIWKSSLELQNIHAFLLGHYYLLPIKLYLLSFSCVNLIGSLFYTCAVILLQNQLHQ